MTITVSPQLNLPRSIAAEKVGRTLFEVQRGSVRGSLRRQNFCFGQFIDPEHTQITEPHGGTTILARSQPFMGNERLTDHRRSPGRISRGGIDDVLFAQKESD
jgi:hypothetical protein